MADSKTLGGIADGLKDQLGNKLDPGELLSARNLKKKRGVFLTCLLAGLLLMLLAMGASVAYNAMRVDLLKAGVDQYVVGQGLLSQSDADAFVTDTLDYLTGIKTVWEPAVTVAGLRVGVPDAFKTHMATVKGWVASAKAILIGGAAIALLLLGRAMIGVKGSRKSTFSAGGYYLGAGIPLLLALGVGLWGYLDFDSLWSWVHKLLIPDGIFPAGEAIMQMFPVTVFSGYLQPVAVTFAICAGAVLVLPLLLWPLSKLLTAMFGKGSGKTRTGGTRSGGTARRTANRAATTQKSTRSTHANR